MPPRTLALILGLVYLGLGVLGLMPGALAGAVASPPALAVAHLGLGAWGLWAHLQPPRAHRYARAAAFVFAALALAGMLEGMERYLGAYVWIHLATAAAAGFVAWRPATGERRGLAGDRRKRNFFPVGIERRHGTSDRRKAPAPA